MKEVKSRTGETELQPPEYVPPGPTSSGPSSLAQRLLVALQRIEALERQVRAHEEWIIVRTRRVG